MNKAEIIALVDSTCDLIREKFIRDFVTPTVLFTLEKKTTAGTANFANNTVNFNMRIAELNPEEFQQTVLHELAHHMTFHHYKGNTKQMHGPEFRSMCRLIGCSGETRHSMAHDPVKKRVMTRYEYTCGCGVHDMTSQQHTKIMRGSRFRCIKCNGSITQNEFVGEVKVASNSPTFRKN